MYKEQGLFYNGYFWYDIGFIFICLFSILFRVCCHDQTLFIVTVLLCLLNISNIRIFILYKPYK